MLVPPFRYVLGRGRSKPDVSSESKIANGCDEATMGCAAGVAMPCLYPNSEDERAILLLEVERPVCLDEGTGLTKRLKSLRNVGHERIVRHASLLIEAQRYDGRLVGVIASPVDEPHIQRAPCTARGIVFETP